MDSSAGAQYGTFNPPTSHPLHDLPNTGLNLGYVMFGIALWLSISVLLLWWAYRRATPNE